MRLGVEAALVRGELVPGDVEVEDGRRRRRRPRPGARGRIAVPGLVDLQVNGFARRRLPLGVDGRLRPAGEALLETGVTAFQPTFITAPESTLLDALRALPPDGAHRAWSARTSRARSSPPHRLGDPPARAPPRSRPRAARPPARRRPRHAS